MSMIFKYLTEQFCTNLCVLLGPKLLLDCENGLCEIIGANGPTSEYTDSCMQICGKTSCEGFVPKWC